MGQSDEVGTTRKEGDIIVIGGAAGVGKTGISNELVRILNADGVPAIKSRKRSTRKSRKHEVPGVDYEYMTAAQFTDSERSGDTVLVYVHDGNRYGHPRETVERLQEGKHVVIEGDIAGVQSLKDFKMEGGLPNRIIPIMLWANYGDGLTRIVERAAGKITLSEEEVRDECELYDANRHVYRHLIHNPDQHIISKDDVIFHLATRIADIVKEESEMEEQIAVELFRGGHVTSVLSRLFHGMHPEEVVEAANAGKLSFDFEDSLLEEYGRRVNLPPKELRAGYSDKKLTAKRRYGIFSIYFKQDEPTRDRLLDLIEMKVGLVPQYRHHQLNYYKASPMSLTSTEGQMNFCLSYSVFDPIHVPHAASDIHTVTIEAVLNGKKPEVGLLDESQAAELWPKRGMITDNMGVPYTKHR